jgi:outer membrane protein OmpA-like peptidoglycan-associated protein
MLSLEQQEQFLRDFIPLRVMTLAMAGGILLCVALTGWLHHALAGRGPLPVDRAPETLRQTFYLLAGLEAAACAALRGRFLSDESLRPLALGGTRELMRAVRLRTLLLLALCESVGFLGIILFILSQRMSDLVSFCAISLFGFLWAWPRRGHWERKVESLILPLALAVIFAGAPRARATPLVHFDTEELELADGERQLKEIEKQVRKGIIAPVQFEFDKAVLHDESQPVLRMIADLLISHTHLKLMVFGHTCDLGSVEYNQRLSQQRAEAVKTALVKLGILGEFIKAKGFGKSRPLVPNDSEDNRVINRRVEFVLTTRWWSSLY